jgi:hypothetical protein
MSKPRLSPLWILFLLWVLFGALLAATYGEWPAQVATHFNLQGKPDSWMDRVWNLVAYAALGIGLPLFIYGIFALSSLFPTNLINLPQRDYWLAPERRAATFVELRRQALWLGCLIVLFVAGLYLITLDANRQQPVALSPMYVALLLAAFFLGVAIWVAFLFRRFWKPELTGVAEFR